MSITHANKINTHSGQDVSSLVTASFAPSANRLVLAFVINRSGSGTAITPTITTTTGLEFVEISNQLISVNPRVTLFRAMKPSGLSSGTATVVLTGQTQSRIHCVIDEFDVVDTSGADGAGAIVQLVQGVNASDTNTSFTRTLAAFGSVNNGTYFGAAWADPNADFTTATPNAGFEEIADTNAYLNASMNRLKRHVAWRADNSTECTSTLDDGHDAKVGMVAVELKAAGAGGGITLTQLEGPKLRGMWRGMAREMKP